MFACPCQSFQDFAYKALPASLDKVHAQTGARILIYNREGEQQKTANRAKSKVHARGGHIFGAQAQMGGHIARTVGTLRAWPKISMMNLVYNMVRPGRLHKRHRRNAPAAA